MKHLYLFCSRKVGSLSVYFDNLTRVDLVELTPLYRIHFSRSYHLVALRTLLGTFD